jgi:predicted RNA-binding protein with PIN domain
MALVRILVDGYSLLHGWRELAPHTPRHSAAAREALVDRLTQYRDASGTPVSIVFDGAPSRGPAANTHSSPDVEVLYSSRGRTADDLIERAAARFGDFGEVLVVTDDVAERETVSAFGASVASCANFSQMVESALAELSRDLKHHNRHERNRFHRRHHAG